MKLTIRRLPLVGWWVIHCPCCCQLPWTATLSWRAAIWLADWHVIQHVSQQLLDGRIEPIPHPVPIDGTRFRIGDEIYSWRVEAAS